MTYEQKIEKSQDLWRRVRDLKKARRHVGRLYKQAGLNKYDDPYNIVVFIDAEIETLYAEHDTLFP